MYYSACMYRMIPVVRVSQSCINSHSSVVRDLRTYIRTLTVTQQVIYSATGSTVIHAPAPTLCEVCVLSIIRVAVGCG